MNNKRNIKIKFGKMSIHTTIPNKIYEIAKSMVDERMFNSMSSFMLDSVEMIVSIQVGRRISGDDLFFQVKEWVQEGLFGSFAELFTHAAILKLIQLQRYPNSERFGEVFKSWFKYKQNPQ